MMKCKGLQIAGIFLAASLAAPAFADMADMPDTTHYAHSFTELKQALEQAKPVVALLDLSQCQNPGDPGKKIPMKGGLAIRSFLELGPNMIVFSDLHPTVDANPPYDLKYEFMRYRVKSDNSMQLETFAWKAADSVRSAPLVLNCRIDHGVKFGW